MRRHIMWTAALALVVSACGGDGTAGGGGDGWAGMLGLVPDTASTREYVAMEDLGGIRDDLEIALPADPTDSEQLAEYLITVTAGPGSGADRSPALGAGVFNVGVYGLADLIGWQTEVGFTVADVDADVAAGAGPDTLSVLRGRFDAAAVAAAVEADPVWSPELREATAAGIDHWCWGDDPRSTDLERRSSFRPLGRGGCLAVVGGDVYRTISPGVMEDALATRSGDAPSLADFEPFRLAAGALDAAGTYAAAFTATPEPYAAASLPSDRPGTVLDRWEAMGVGAGYDADGEYAVVALVYADEATASEAVGRLEEIVASERSVRISRVWADAADGPVAVASDGRVVTAVLPGVGLSTNWLAFLFVPDTLTAWE